MKTKMNKFYSVTMIFYLLTAGFFGLILTDEHHLELYVKGESIIVDPLGNGNYTKIQTAINNAKAGDVIYVWSGEYKENLVINKPITLIGNGSISTTINGSWNGDVIYISADWVNISGITVNNSGHKGAPVYDSGIHIDNSDHAKLRDITYKSNYGVMLNRSQFCSIENSKFHCMYGIYPLFSNCLGIRNNSYTDVMFGIWPFDCDNMEIVNNSFFRKNYPNMVFWDIIYNNVNCSKVMKNKMYNGIVIYGTMVEHWNSHTFDYTNTVQNKPVEYWKDQTGGFAPSNMSMIILANCTGVTVANHNFDEVSYAVQLGFSSMNTISDNKVTNSSGLVLSYGSYYNTFSRNTGINSVDGFFCWNSHNNSFIDNQVRDGYTGINFYSGCDYNSIINNNFTNNDPNGISLHESDNNLILQNNLTESWGGVLIRSSDFNYLMGNYAVSNTRGIDLRDSSYNEIYCNNASRDLIGINLVSSDRNLIYGNTALLNDWHGIYLEDSDRNDIGENWFCQNTDHGLFFDSDSTENLVESNIIKSNSDTGIHLSSSDSNEFVNNTVAYNRRGITLVSSDYNEIYFNNVISNTEQASDTGNNHWNASWHEGNFWSDYTGQDDGSGGRLLGDGIGDTNIPHLGLDNYPFMIPSGWIYLRAPVLSGPTGVVNDGNYTIRWNMVSGATSYYLEEDDSSDFSSPSVVYEGSGDSCAFTGKNDGTYYYRIASRNETAISRWSRDISVIVDRLPAVPGKLIVKPYPPGNVLNISWATNTVDTQEYELCYRSGGAWQQLVVTQHPLCCYNHTGLKDGQTYDYKVRARDYRGQYSNYTIVTAGIPADTVAPAPPTGLEAIAISNSKVKLSWKASPEPDTAGYQVFINDTGTGPGITFRPIEIVNRSTTTFTVSGLAEVVEYHFTLKAFDEVPNNSSFSEIVTAITPDETPPSGPTGLVATKRTYASITLGWDANTEPDLDGYNVYRSRIISGNYKQLNTVLLEETEYKDLDLNEATEYFYRLTAVDHTGLVSEYSKVISVTTLFAPAPPEVNNSIDFISINEDAYDDSINLYFMFYDKNDDPLRFSCSGQENIRINIDQNTGGVRLYPEPDWNGDEVITFYANDGMFNTSTDVDVQVIPVNDPPGMPEILSPANGSKFKKDDKIDLKGICHDPDLPGDRLMFYWYSNLSGLVGTGGHIKDLVLEPGVHKITLKVEDQYYESAQVSITITVEEGRSTGDDPAGKSDDENKDNLIKMFTAIIVIIIIIVTVLSYMYLQKRKKEGQDGSSSIETNGTINPQPATIPYGQYPNYGIPQVQYQEQPGIQQPDLQDQLYASAPADAIPEHKTEDQNLGSAEDQNIEMLNNILPGVVESEESQVVTESEFIQND